MKRLMLLLAIPLAMLVFAFYGCKEQPKEEVGEVQKEVKEAKPAEKQKPKPVKKPKPVAKVNINTATVGELAQVPGIGEKLANRIVKYRDKHGNFQTIEDVKKVKSNWDKRYKRAENYITVGEPGTPEATVTPAPEEETSPQGGETTPAPETTE